MNRKNVHMNYNVNIAKKNKDGALMHWASVTLPEGYENEAVEKFLEIENLFKVSDGFELELSLIETLTEKITISRDTIKTK